MAASRPAGHAVAAFVCKINNGLHLRIGFMSARLRVMQKACFQHDTSAAPAEGQHPKGAVRPVSDKEQQKCPS